MFDGIATINTEKETITFLSAAEIRRTMREYYINMAEKMKAKAEAGGMDWYDWWSAANYFRYSYTLFYMDRAQTSHWFMDDARFHEGETWAIGNIFDAHM